MDHSDSVFKGSEIIVKTHKELLKLLINIVESKSNDSKNNLLSEILHSIFTSGLKDVDNKVIIIRRNKSKKSALKSQSPITNL